MTVAFLPPSYVATEAYHHSRAASQNEAAAKFAKGQLLDALNGSSDVERILLKAAAGAGKSFLLRGLVRDAIAQPQCLRVAVTAFQNRQLWPLAASLGKELGKDHVYLWASKRVFPDVPDWVKASATVVDSVTAVAHDAPVVLTRGGDAHTPAGHVVWRVHAAGCLDFRVGSIASFPPLPSGIHRRVWQSHP
mgnify:CR=1 FL=1